MDNTLKNINNIHIKKYYIDQLIELVIVNIISTTVNIANLIKKELSKNEYKIDEYYTYFYSIWSTSYQLFTFPLYQEIAYDENYLSQYNVRFPLKRLTIEAYLHTICAQYMIMKTKEYNNINFVAYRGIQDTQFDNDIKYNQTIVLNEIKNIPKSEHVMGFLKLYDIIYENLYDDYELDLIKYSDYNTFYSELMEYYNINMNNSNSISKLKDIVNNPLNYKIPSRIKAPNYPDNMIDDWITLHMSFNKFKDVKFHFKSYNKYIQNNSIICEIPFRSFTIDKTVTDKFTGKNTCCLIQTNMRPNTPYLWIGGQGEREILFPLLAEFSVITTNGVDVNLEYIGSNFQITEEEFYLHLKYYMNFRDYMLDEDQLRKQNQKLYFEIMDRKEKFITKCQKYHDEFNKKYNIIS